MLKAGGCEAGNSGLRSSAGFASSLGWCLNNCAPAVEGTRQAASARSETARGTTAFHSGPNVHLGIVRYFRRLKWSFGELRRFLHVADRVHEICGKARHGAEDNSAHPKGRALGSNDTLDYLWTATGADVTGALTGAGVDLPMLEPALDPMLEPPPLDPEFTLPCDQAPIEPDE